METKEIVNASYELMNSYKKHSRIPTYELESIYEHILKLEELAPSNNAASEAFRMIYNLCDRNWPVYKRIKLYHLIESMSNVNQAYITFLPELIAVLNELNEQHTPLETPEKVKRKSFNYVVYYLASAKVSLYRAGQNGIFNQMILTEMIKSLPSLSLFKESDLKKELTYLCSPTFPHEEYSEKWYFDH